MNKHEPRFLFVRSFKGQAARRSLFSAFVAGAGLPMIGRTSAATPSSTAHFSFILFE
jgi:hypothetical protein